MAASDKNIVISPQRGSATEQPSIVFTGDGNDPLTLRVLDSTTGSVSIEGSAGQLFGISNNLATGSIFSANYASGIPAIDVNASGVVSLVPTVGKVGIGTTNPLEKLHVESSLTVKNTGSSNTITIYPDNTNGPTIVGHTDSSGISTGAYTGSRFRPANGGFFFDTSPVTTVGVSRSWTTRVVITDIGNVGIGTTNPQSKIHINAESGTVSTGASVGVIGRRLSFNNSTSDTYGALNIGDWNTLGQRVIVSISSRQSGSTGGQYYENGGEIATLRFTGTGTDTATGMVASEITVSSSEAGFGNTNTSPSDLIFRVSGSGGTRTVPVERLRITGSGNIGIGTTDPSTKLQVEGTIWVRGGGSFRAYRSDNSRYGAVYHNTDGVVLEAPVSGDNAYVRSVNNDVHLRTGSTNRLTVLNAGNVGINNTNPASRLAVNGYITESTDSGTTYWNVVTQQDVGTSPNQVPLNQYLGQLAFMDDFSPNGLRRDGGSIDDVVVNSSGYVGIGETNPNCPLDITTTSASSYTDGGGSLSTPNGEILKIRNLDTTTNNTAAFATFHARGNAGTMSIWYAGNTGGSTSGLSGAFVIGHRTGDPQYTERLRINSSGNVGIGTTNPSSKLDVIGDSGIFVKTITNAPTDGAQIRFSDQTTGTPYGQVGYIRYKHSDGTSPGSAYGNHFEMGGSETEFALKLNGDLLVWGKGAKSFSRIALWPGPNGANLTPSSRIEFWEGDTEPNLTSYNNAHMTIEYDGGTTYGGDGSLLIRGFTTSANQLIAGFSRTGNSFFTGNVGIGTTNPTDKLTIHGGNVYIKGQPSFGTTVYLDENGGTSNSIYLDTYFSNSVISNPLVGVTINASPELILKTNRIGIANLYQSPFIDIVPYSTLNGGTLSFEGSAGQLFSITNNLITGSIFSVNDVSGIPSLDVDADGTVSIAPYSGNVGIGTTNPSTKLDVNSDSIRVVSPKTPSSASDAGVVGQICWDANYVYVCVATNTWKRSALSSW